MNEAENLLDKNDINTERNRETTEEQKEDISNINSYKSPTFEETEKLIKERII